MMEPQNENPLISTTSQPIVPLTTATTQSSIDGLTSLVDTSLTLTNLPAPSAIPSLGIGTSGASISPTPSALVPSYTQMQPVLSTPTTVPLLQQNTYNVATPPFTPASPPTGLLSGPPPKTGFQPVPHVVKSYQSHHSPPVASQGHSMPPVAPTSTEGVAGVSIFTPPPPPDANSVNPSPYASSVPQPQYGMAPQPAGSSNTSVQLTMGDTPDNSFYQGNMQPGLGNDKGIIDWLKTNETVNMVMHKAKTGVQNVITAMDPQMRDVLYSGGDINIVVASLKDVKVDPVKLAFQDTFGRATVNGMESQPGIAPQPVGYTSGIKGAEERIANLRRSGQVSAQQVCVAVESFIVDIQPEKWYDISCLLLDDPVNNISLQTFSQATPVKLDFVLQAQNETASDYPLSWSGLAITVGQLMHRQCAVDPSDWHFYFSGISRRDTLKLAAKQLAHMYKQSLPRH